MIRNFNLKPGPEPLHGKAQSHPRRPESRCHSIMLHGRPALGWQGSAEHCHGTGESAAPSNSWRMPVEFEGFSLVTGRAVTVLCEVYVRCFGGTGRVRMVAS